MTIETHQRIAEPSVALEVEAPGIFNNWHGCRHICFFPTKWVETSGQKAIYLGTGGPMPCHIKQDKTAPTTDQTGGILVCNLAGKTLRVGLPQLCRTQARPARR